MPWIAVPILAILGLGLGYAVAKMPCWKSWQGYVALLIVALLAFAGGIPPIEVIVDCASLGAGFAWSRK